MAIKSGSRDVGIYFLSYKREAKRIVARSCHNFFLFFFPLFADFFFFFVWGKGYKIETIYNNLIDRARSFSGEKLQNRKPDPNCPKCSRTSGEKIIFYPTSLNCNLKEG